MQVQDGDSGWAIQSCGITAMNNQWGAVNRSDGASCPSVFLLAVSYVWGIRDGSDIFIRMNLGKNEVFLCVTALNTFQREYLVCLG